MDQLVAHERLKTKGDNKIVTVKVVAVAYQGWSFQLQGFDWGKWWCFAGIYGGLWEVVAHGNSTVQTETNDTF